MQPPKSHIITVTAGSVSLFQALEKELTDLGYKVGQMFFGLNTRLFIRGAEYKITENRLHATYGTKTDESWADERLDFNLPGEWDRVIEVITAMSKPEEFSMGIAGYKVKFSSDGTRISVGCMSMSVYELLELQRLANWKKNH